MYEMKKVLVRKNGKNTAGRKTDSREVQQKKVEFAGRRRIGRKSQMMRNDEETNKQRSKGRRRQES